MHLPPLLEPNHTFPYISINSNKRHTSLGTSKETSRSGLGIRICVLHASRPHEYCAVDYVKIGGNSVVRSLFSILKWAERTCTSRIRAYLLLIFLPQLSPRHNKAKFGALFLALMSFCIFCHMNVSQKILVS